MTVLFVTQKLHQQDAFAILWVNAFRAQGFEVKVVCLEDRASPQSFEIHSMGKEKGYGKLRQIITFWKLIATLKYDRVFVHMSPVWGLLGAWYWWPKRVPTYLWYTHYKMQAGLWLLALYGKRLFCATPQSLPQYEGSPKKVVVGHGIDLQAWPKTANRCRDPRQLLMVHRLARSKRVEICIRAMTLLPQDYTLTIYGIEPEPAYIVELKRLTKELGLESRVTFMGTVPMERLKDIYPRHRLILNMASETIDKSMLEAMIHGCYPVTTKRNAEAIGITAAPREDTPEALAAFIKANTDKLPMTPDQMYDVVKERHSLDGLVRRMSDFIRQGT